MMRGFKPCNLILVKNPNLRRRVIREKVRERGRGPARRRRITRRGMRGAKEIMRYWLTIINFKITVENQSRDR